VLIPYPYAAEDHQSFNAAVFAAAGAAMVMPQGDLTAEIFRDKVLGLLEDPDRLEQMAEATANLATRDSAEQLADLVEKAIARTL
jgi:UDP-N-acetylglucosamine--N-acetylmuramyl-(pentapeptide) pyrophosphoryl-undecaprenol N-acetylglucosamine transferase